MSRLGAIAARLGRSSAVGVVATLADLGTLAILVHLIGLTLSIASVPGLLVGNIVMFFGQKYIAFRAGGRMGKQMVLFAAVQGGNMLLAAALFELTLRVLPASADFYVIVRLVVNGIAWLFFSFPLWHFVFRQEATQGD